MQSQIQKQKVWQPLGTDLHCKYNVLPSNVKLESKANVTVLMASCY